MVGQLLQMAPFKRSPILLNYHSDDDEIAHRLVKVKRCTCSTNPYNCTCHPCFPNAASRTTSLTNCRTNLSKSASPSESSLISLRTATTLKAEDFKISVPSMTSTCTSTHIDDSNRKEEAFRNWCMKKYKERKKAEEERIKIEEARAKEREMMLERERENFKKWLTMKKEEEERRRKEKTEELEKEKIKKTLKEQRRLENELKYRLWLKQKEELFLENKLKEQMESVRLEEERQQRMMESAKAYDEWLSASKYKPKPVPLNQGLESLKLSQSVTYINPKPWVPNINDNEQKPMSR